jgi:molybdopterin-guanine dinucleotide biosynthesis protein
MLTDGLDLVSQRSFPFVVGVGGFTSGVGKTTLMCDLVRAFPGWEAIKTTRGHYRSCGKDPQACCVSHLLEDRPVVRSIREQTYHPAKDTGRYWDAGASDVHWVIATDEQVEAGIKQAIGRVKSDGVFVEGNSFSRFIKPDFFVMVVRADDLRIKPTARQGLSRVSAFYLSGATSDNDRKLLEAFLVKINGGKLPGNLSIVTSNQFPKLVERIVQTVEINSFGPRRIEANPGGMNAS